MAMRSKACTHTAVATTAEEPTYLPPCSAGILIPSLPTSSLKYVTNSASGQILLGAQHRDLGVLEGGTITQAVLGRAEQKFGSRSIGYGDLAIESDQAMRIHTMLQAESFGRKRKGMPEKLWEQRIKKAKARKLRHTYAGLIESLLRRSNVTNAMWKFRSGASNAV